MACIAFGAPLCHGLLLSLAGSGALAFLILGALGYAAGGLASVGIGVAQAWKGRWDAVLPCLFIPAAVAMFVACPWTYAAIQGSADYVHFIAFSPRYEWAVNATPRSGEPRCLMFLWNTLPGGFMGPDNRISLAFDESDEFARPDANRPDAWKVRAERAFEKETGDRHAPSMPDEARHLFGHWYVFRVDD